MAPKRSKNQDDSNFIAVEVAIPGLPSPLLYRVPETMGAAGVGSQVEVELNGRRSSGWIVGQKPLESALDEMELLLQQKQRADSNQIPLLPECAGSPVHRENLRRMFKPLLSASPAFLPEQLPLFRWMADYYGASLAEVIDTALPTVRVLKRPKKTAAAVDPDYVFSFSKPETLTPAQTQAIESISAAVAARTFSPTLLFGVTGSGKTEVYLRCIEQALAAGRSALVVVPEISLTPQLIDHFQSRLGVPLALLHSQVSPAARWETWQSILRGELHVALGARSAVFAPLHDLALIIIDEEHDGSFKQSDNLRYNARDAAVMRAKLAQCTVVLGSATPSFESLSNVMRKRYRLLEMPERATTRPLPTIEIVDMNRLRRKEMPSPSLSPQLYAAMQQTIENHGQIILLYNRRGFSTYLQCDTCGEVVACPNCSVALTYHKKRNRLLCHYCDLSMIPPGACKFCRDPKMSRIELDATGTPVVDPAKVEEIGHLSHRGAGTERVAEEIQALFPQAQIVRMDRDTTTSKDSYRTILGSMRSGKADILVGTQMIAKGHDLPGVTLVGIIDADVGLHIPDFRSSERVFQLITQAAGRAGRGSEKGTVLVQTREPNHPSILATSTGRFKAFARFELEQRKSLNYPPWGRLMRIVISSKEAPLAFRAAASTAAAVKSLLQRFTEPGGESAPEIPPAVLGPAPCPHEKLRGRYRHHVLVKAPSARILSELARSIAVWQQEQKDWTDVRIGVDIDPVDML